MTFEKYVYEVYDYLHAKLPDTNDATLCEIAEFFVMKSNNFAHDMIEKNNEMWRKEFERSNKQFDKLLEKVYK